MIAVTLGEQSTLAPWTTSKILIIFPSEITESNTAFKIMGCLEFLTMAGIRVQLDFVLYNASGMGKPSIYI